MDYLFLVWLAGHVLSSVKYMESDSNSLLSLSQNKKLEITSKKTTNIPYVDSGRVLLSYKLCTPLSLIRPLELQKTVPEFYRFSVTCGAVVFGFMISVQNSYTFSCV